MGRAEDLFEAIQAGGEDAIDRFILSRQHEELFLDFKRGNGDGTTLHADDRKGLARAISGFGNSEGGVIVWGVDCHSGGETDPADVARAKRPLPDVARFVSWIEGAVSGCTLPPHSGVRTVPLERPGQQSGFAVTLIPASPRAPHQVVGGDRAHFYIRAGSAFSPAPYGVIAGLFGRKPAPLVELLVSRYYSNCRVQIQTSPAMTMHGRVGLVLRNAGVTLLRDFYLVATSRTPGVAFEMHRPEERGTRLTMTGGVSRIEVVAKASSRLPPAGEVVMASCTFPLRTNDQHHPVDIALTYGAAGAPVKELRLAWSANEVRLRTEAVLADVAAAPSGGESKQAAANAAFLVHFFAGLVQPLPSAPE